MTRCLMERRRWRHRLRRPCQQKHSSGQRRRPMLRQNHDPLPRLPQTAAEDRKCQLQLRAPLLQLPVVSLKVGGPIPFVRPSRQSAAIAMRPLQSGAEDLGRSQGDTPSAAVLCSESTSGEGATVSTSGTEGSQWLTTATSASTSTDADVGPGEGDFERKAPKNAAASSGASTHRPARTTCRHTV